jgi:hypothetical protein
MSRQHATPLIVPAIGVAVPLAALGPEAHGWSEAKVQALIQAHPACLPIREIDPLFADPVPLCTEMSTGAGPIDNVMITASGLPVLVECKLWRNPQARREVIGQILDYAKELSRWTASDLQREVSRRTGRTGNAVVDLVREAGHQVDEIGFTDAVTLNLRRGRFLLLIVGDGIRQGVEAIAEYLQGHSGLHFTLGLVEMPIFAMPDGARLVAPRVLARTASITRDVVALPEGFVLQEEMPNEPDGDDQLTGEEALRRNLLQQVISDLTFDDPDQSPPLLSTKGWLNLYLSAPSNSCWITVLFQNGGRRVGVRLSANANSVGDAALRYVIQDWNIIQAELGGNPTLKQLYVTRSAIDDYLDIDLNAGAIEREQAAIWVRDRLRAFVSVFRPRIRNAVKLIEES